MAFTFTLQIASVRESFTLPVSYFRAMLISRPQILKSTLALLLMVGGVIGLQHWRWQTRFAAEGMALSEQAQSEAQQAASQVEILKNIPSLGFRNLIADWAFLQFLQYFGNREHRQITGYKLTEDYFEVIIERDPYAYDPYIFLSTSLTLYAAQPERAVELQEQGLQSLTPQLPPESFYIWRQKGIDEMLFLGDYEAAQRSHEIAAEWAEQSADPRGEAAAQSFRKTAEFLRTDPENAQMQANAWLQVAASARDRQTRQIAINAIESLGYELVPVGNSGFTIRPKSPASTDNNS